jgi:hypothetical protein
LSDLFQFSLIQQKKMAEAQQRIKFFYHKLQELKDWPDRDIITAATNLARDNIALAQPFSEVILQRFLEPQLPTSYKRPLFYLLDSIMKSVGGPYAALMETHFSGTYSLILRDIHAEEDIRKLDFLFTTWEERNFLSGSLLSKMKYQLQHPPVVSNFKYYNIVHLCFNKLSVFSFPFPFPFFLSRSFTMLLSYNNNNYSILNFNNNNNKEEEGGQ